MPNVKHKRHLFKERVRLFRVHKLVALQILPGVGELQHQVVLVVGQYRGRVVLRALGLVVELPQVEEARRVVTFYASNC